PFRRADARSPGRVRRRRARARRRRDGAPSRRGSDRRPRWPRHHVGVHGGALCGSLMATKPHRVTLLVGDGAGPEVADATLLDLVVIRETTEGEYAGLEHRVVPGVVESIKVVTESGCTRIAEFAFAFAARTGRKKISAIHKANILKVSDGLFLDCVRKVASRH